MKIEMSMIREETKLQINSWWAASAGFAIGTLRDQLEAAKILWPEELCGFNITFTENPAPASTPVTTEIGP